QFYESALAMKPNDDGYRALALARARHQEAVRARAAEAEAARERQLRGQREAELAKVRGELEAQRTWNASKELARRKAQEDRALAQYTILRPQAQPRLAQAKQDAAIASLQSARQLRKTEEVERLLNDALLRQARLNAERKGAAERAALEQQLAAEKAR